MGCRTPHGKGFGGKERTVLQGKSDTYVSESFLRQNNYGHHHRANFREVLSCCGHPGTELNKQKGKQQQMGGPCQLVLMMIPN